MNDIFVSFILCSRKRPERLLKFISSVYNTVDNPDEIEIYIKFDDDDLESISKIEEYKKFKNVKIMIGPRLNGYTSCEFFLNKMIDDTNAKWVSVVNDDMYLIGKGLDTQLKQITETNCIVYPNKHQLGDSIYENAPGMAFYFVPNKCWKQYGLDMVHHPVDTCLNVFLHQNQWKDVFIELHTVHNRDSDDLLNEHRKT